MQVPGFLLTALLALIPLLVQWLGGDYFAGQAWVPWAVIALGFAGKLIEMLAAQKRAAARPALPETFFESAAVAAPESPARRFLLG